MTVIELTDEQATALTARAEAQGLTLEAWFKKLATEGEMTGKSARSSQEAAAHILELQKLVKPDPDGWTVKDYTDYGRP